ncbi:antitermination protein [Escherichia sp. E1130]|uniref:antitermination protein Q n=1 Tax=Escherichia sp. E1130 TaxID=2041645 RepID=UPI00108060F7|nr:antitermination protein [Escherichia sp. E1130]TGC25849.1 antitermination protein [Escherichia sp. E1130]TLI75870.1 antitermination protein [Escherichia sp. E1130]
MNLESIAKYFAPKSPMFSDSSRATATDNLTGTDVMAALGLVNARCGFGFDLYLAKIGISSPDRALEELYVSAVELSRRCKSVTELDETIRRRVLEIMCAFAYQDYTRSAASVRQCDCCAGSGFTEADVFTNKVQYPDGKPPKWAAITNGVYPSYWEEWKSVRETARVMCNTCNGKGVISNACRCHGKGKVLDKKATELQGVPVMKECGKCSGRGYARLPAESVRKALCEGVMTISQPTWSRNFKPLFELLVSQCHVEESHADAALKSVTR